MVALNFPLAGIHPHAVQAAKMAVCAGRVGRYWEMHDALFRLGARLDEARLAEQVESVGVHAEVMEECLADEAVSAEVKADVEEGYRLGVNGTPTFFLGWVQQDGAVALKKRFTRRPSLEQLRAQVDNLVTEQSEQ